MKRVSKYLAAATAVLLPAAWAWAAPAVVTSPDGKITIRIEDDASRFTVARQGQPVIAASPLGLEFDRAPELGALALEKREDGAAPNDVRRSQRDVTASDQLTLRLATAGGAAVILEPAK